MTGRFGPHAPAEPHRATSSTFDPPTAQLVALGGLRAAFDDALLRQRSERTRVALVRARHLLRTLNEILAMLVVERGKVDYDDLAARVTRAWVAVNAIPSRRRGSPQLDGRFGKLLVVLIVDGAVIDERAGTSPVDRVLENFDLYFGASRCKTIERREVESAVVLWRAAVVVQRSRAKAAHEKARWESLALLGRKLTGTKVAADTLKRDYLAHRKGLKFLAHDVRRKGKETAA